MDYAEKLEDFSEAWGNDDMETCLSIFRQIPRNIAFRELTMGQSFTMVELDKE